MKVLLIGEYSGVHTNLAKALRSKNIDVFCVHDGDGYKDFSADYQIKYKYITTNSFFLRKILSIWYLILKFTGLIGVIQILKHISEIKKFKDFDVVQLINPIALSDFGSVVNYILFRYLLKNNKKIFLCALGDDYVWVKGSMEDKEHYSMLSEIKIRNFKHYIYPFLYRYGFLYKKLNLFIIKKCNRVIPGLQDYYKYYKKYANCNEIIPIAIDVDPTVKPLVFNGYPIKIFHGWQKGKEVRKGNDIFDSVIQNIIKKYPDLVNYQIVSNVPYKEYIQLYKDSIIFLDQCYSMDRGVNALLGMAAGKIVVGGFNKDLQNHYNVADNQILLNVNNEKSVISDKIEYIINNPKVIESISKESIEFIKRYHNFDKVGSSYIEVWEKF